MAKKTEQGFYIQNETPYNQVCQVDKEFRLSLKPKGNLNGGDVAYIPEKYADNMLVHKMLKNKTVSRMDTKKAQEAEDAAFEARVKSNEDRTKELQNNLDSSPKNDYVQVRCCAINVNGSRCKREFTIKVVELDAANGLVFCAQNHKDEDREKYVKVNGEWVLRD